MVKFGPIPLLVLAACGSGASVVVESRSPAIQGHQLQEAVGIQTLGGVFTPILEPGCRMPCEVTNIFSTSEDNQTEILLLLFRGSKPVAVENHSLGTIAILDIPPLPRGRPSVAVTLKAIGGDIIVTARDSSHSRLRIELRGAKPGA